MKCIRKIIMLAAIIIVPVILCASYKSDPIVKTGLETLIASKFEVLKGKKIGLITNPTGVDHNLRSTIDILFNAQDVRLIALFSPEHGVRGDFTAGEQVGTGCERR